MVLRCAGCKLFFTVKGIPEADVARTPDITSCPHCAHIPTPTAFLRRQHLITSLEKESKESS
jgi:hypothetical protein